LSGRAENLVEREQAVSGPARKSERERSGERTAVERELSGEWQIRKRV
jgi:hypothetical protein